MSIEAMKLALNALENSSPLGFNMESDKKFFAAITALRQAIEQAEQAQPVAWMITTEMQDGTKSTFPMQGRFKDVKDCCDFGEPIPLYTAPPPRQPLTDAQADRLYANIPPSAQQDARSREAFRRIVRIVEAAHGIKENT